MEFRCPVPNCAHVGLIITKVHYRDAHNLDRRQAELQYGSPKPIKELYTPYKEKKMKSRQYLKLLKKVAVKQAEHLKDFGYATEVAKLNEKTLVVRAENSRESYKVFVDKPQPPYNTAIIRKGDPKKWAMITAKQ